MTRRTLLSGSIGLVVALFAGALLAWFYWSPPITKQQAEQRNNSGDVTLKVNTILSGLQNPWDIAFLPDDTLLLSERGGELSKLVDGKKVVIQTIDDVQAQGEGGLTGMTLDSDFTHNKYLYTCYNSTAGDVRVVRWNLNNKATELTDKTPIVTSIPSNSSGRHSGCRVKSAKDGTLWIGTGDAAKSSHPQDLQSLGGKVLHVTRDGKPVIGNMTNGDARIFSYGHRIMCKVLLCLIVQWMVCTAIVLNMAQVKMTKSISSNPVTLVGIQSRHITKAYQ